MTEGYEREVSTRNVIIGTSSLTPSFTVFFRGDELKKIIEQMRTGEDLRITVWECVEKPGAFPKCYHSFQIVDTHQKYPRESDK